MSQKEWTSTSIAKLYKYSPKLKSRQVLFNAEERGEIPKASRISRGTTQVRVWDQSQLPDIGKKFGFLESPASQQIISIYTSKGGVLKSTFAHNMGRLLAINGIKVLLVGLDIQLSLTEAILPTIAVDSLDEVNNEIYGLYHYFYEKTPLEKIVLHTELSTLDYIPETPELNALEKSLRNENRREYFIKDRLITKLKHYDVIIFDNSPHWSCLIENSLAASNHIISPIGCEINSYRALKQHIDFIEAFSKNMHLYWDNFILLPTLLEKTKLSQQIYGAYLTEYPKEIVATPVRRAVTGHEASLLGISVIEHDPTSALASDYFDIIQTIWPRVIKKQLTEKTEAPNRSAALATET
jgi:chromosome partitioning protein